MNNSLKTKEQPPKRGADALARGKTKTFLIGKKLKTNNLRHTAAVWASGPTTKPNPNPRIAYAERRIKPLARLLRVCRA